MSKSNKDNPYDQILTNMREYPQDIPLTDGKVSDAFREYIELLFTPEEAEIAQYLEVKPQPVRILAKKLGKEKEEVEKVLEDMVDKGIIQDIGGYSYFLTMAHLLNVGYKYSKALERLGEKGAELYEKFFIHEKFYKRYESSDEGTSLMRIVPVEQSINYKTEILNVEEVHKILEQCQKPIVITDCPCRKRTEILGKRECKDKFPIENSCFQLGFFGSYFLRRGEGKQLSIEEAKELVDKFATLGLVFTTENHKNVNHQVLCCCCECCCSLLRGMTRFEDKNKNCVAKSNYVSRVDENLCKQCGLCVDRCPFNAIKLHNKKAEVNPDKCYGCGVCAVTCPTEAIRLYKEERNTLFKNPALLQNTIYKENRE
ncbi:MAG: 4Fe-4S dicluster domain-containing protein [Candidatus Lokiarchaeota archaeon]|nr:4Fe-4S dicluster domain-containing protein [Candidatus Lokiarchaeota archaeon]